MSPAAGRTLAAVRKALVAQHGACKPPGPKDPFAQILWVQVGYMAGDAQRAAAFRRLKQEVGVTPRAILDADVATLESICRVGGGIAVAQRAGRMQTSAQRALDDWGGSLKKVLKLPLDEAVRALAKFPMIGKPGAESILLHAGAHPVLGLDSNGLRVLLRLGYGRKDERYDKAYAGVRAAVADELRDDAAWVAGLAEGLRRHGQTVCRNARPRCGECRLATLCTDRSRFTDG